MRMRTVSIGLDRPPKPCDRLLPIAEVILRVARHMHRGRAGARAEAQGFHDMGLCFLGPTDISLTQSDIDMGDGEISIQRQRMFTPGDALRYALRHYFDIP